MNRGIETTATVDPDGVLRLPLNGLENATVQVTLHVRRRGQVDVGESGDNTIAGWEELSQEEYTGLTFEDWQ